MSTDPERPDPGQGECHTGEIRSDFLSPGYTARCSCGWVGQGDDEVWPTSRAAEAQHAHHLRHAREGVHVSETTVRRWTDPEEDFAVAVDDRMGRTMTNVFIRRVDPGPDGSGRITVMLAISRAGQLKPTGVTLHTSGTQILTPEKARELAVVLIEAANAVDSR